MLWISVTRQWSPGFEGVAGGHAAGVPVHAVQPDTARLLGGDGGQHGSFPAKVAVAVGGGGGLAQLCGQRPEGQQAQHAHHDEQQRLHPEQIGEQTADQRGGRADGKPDGGHIKGTTLQHQKADRGNAARKMGRCSWAIPSLRPYYRASPWGKVKCFLLERCAENKVWTKMPKKNRKSHGRGVPEKLPVCRCAPLCEKVSWEDPQIFPAYRSKSNSAKDAQSASGEHFKWLQPTGITGCRNSCGWGCGRFLPPRW